MGQLKWYQDPKPIYPEIKPITPLIKTYELPKSVPRSPIPERIILNTELKSIITKLLPQQPKPRASITRHAFTSMKKSRDT